MLQIKNKIASQIIECLEDLITELEFNWPSFETQDKIKEIKNLRNAIKGQLNEKHI